MDECQFVHDCPLLGARVRDCITGFEGICTGHGMYLSGCNQYYVVPRVDKEGKRRDGEWFDEQRLAVVQKEEQVASLDNVRSPGADALPPQR